LWASWPLKYDVVETAEIKKNLERDPPRTREYAVVDIGLTQIKYLDSAKRKNAGKGYLLVGALTCQILAVACVGVAILEIINP
jgi:hypothetical protein